MPRFQGDISWQVFDIMIIKPARWTSRARVACQSLPLRLIWQAHMQGSGRVSGSIFPRLLSLLRLFLSFHYLHSPSTGPRQPCQSSRCPPVAQLLLYAP
jgi:hypothetical protein